MQEEEQQEHQKRINTKAWENKQAQCSRCKTVVGFFDSKDSMFFCCTYQNALCLKCVKFGCPQCKKKMTYKLDNYILVSKIKKKKIIQTEVPKNNNNDDNQKVINPQHSISNHKNAKDISPLKRSKPVKTDNKICIACGKQIYQSINTFSTQEIQSTDGIIICRICKSKNQIFFIKLNDQPRKQIRKDPVLHLKPIPNEIPVKPNHQSPNSKHKYEPTKNKTCINCEQQFIEQIPIKGQMQDQTGFFICRNCKVMCSKQQQSLSNSKNRSFNRDGQKWDPPKKQEISIKEQKQKIRQKPQYRSPPNNMVSTITETIIIRSKSDDQTDFKRKYSIEEPAQTEQLEIVLDQKPSYQKPNKPVLNSNQKISKTKSIEKKMQIQVELAVGQNEHQIMPCMVCKYSIEFCKGYYYSSDSKQIKSPQQQSCKSEQAIIELNLLFMCCHCVRKNVTIQQNQREYYFDENDYSNEYIMENGFRKYH